MSGYSLMVLLHVLLFVYWVGADLGVFYINFLVLDRQLSVETRGILAKVMLNLDLAPRISLVVTLPVGLTLAGWLGLSPIQGGWLVPVWIFAIAWLAGVLTIHRAHGSALGQRVGRVDTVVRLALIVALLGAAIASLVGDGPFLTTWLPLKIALFAVAIACGLGIRVVLKPFGPALAAMLAGDRSDAVEDQLRASLRRTYPLVFAIWLAVVGAAALGIAKI